MDIELKSLSEQTVVITGASSGIGLATARLAAKRGARVVLASRGKTDLRSAVRDITKRGGEATYIVADVAGEDEVEKIARHAHRKYGGFDTWVNNAGVSIYGRLEETPPEDARRLFETNYWGVVNGSLAALPTLKEGGGALINLGSVVSDRAIPLQGHYSASKHAVKAFTDALRMELEEEGAPVSVTLIKPSAIDTPYPSHARNLMDAEPTLPPPVYDPRVVAKTILRCAEHPRRDIVVGGGGKMLSALGRVLPGLMDSYMEASMFDQQKTDEPRPRKRRDGLYKPVKKDIAERGNYDGHVMGSSIYTGTKMHPLRTAFAVAAIGAGLMYTLRNDDAFSDGPGTG